MLTYQQRSGDRGRTKPRNVWERENSGQKEELVQREFFAVFVKISKNACGAGTFCHGNLQTCVKAEKIHQSPFTCYPTSIMISIMLFHCLFTFFPRGFSWKGEQKLSSGWGQQEVRGGRSQGLLEGQLSSSRLRSHLSEEYVWICGLSQLVYYIKFSHIFQSGPPVVIFLGHATQ